MNEIPHQENQQNSLQITQSLQLIVLLKKLGEEVNSLDVQSSQTFKPNDEILDEFIEQCFDNSSNDLNTAFSSFVYQIDQDHYTTKRGNCCLLQNGLKVFQCQKCQLDFKTPQKLGHHTLKTHHIPQKIKKQIKKD